MAAPATNRTASPTHEERPDHRGELAQHVVEAEELGGPVSRNDPGVERSAQGLLFAPNRSPSFPKAMAAGNQGRSGRQEARGIGMTRRGADGQARWHDRRPAEASVTTGKSTGAGRIRLVAGAWASVLLLMPLLLPPYYLIVLCHALVLSIACLGVNLLLGTTGLLSLGHAAYFGVGAYAGGVLFTFFDVRDLEVYLLSGVLASTALSAVFGAVCVRGTSIHFTILTLALAQVVHSLFISGIAFRPAGGLGKGLFLLGGGGLYIPRFAIVGTDLAPDRFIPALYYVILVAFFGSLFLLWRIGRSPFGMALRAIRDNETRAAFVGIRVRRYRWYAFMLSGVFTGLAGGLFGQLDRQVTPEQLHWVFSAKLVLATVLGGTGRFLGPVAGAFAFVALQELSLRVTLYHGLVLGAILIVVVLAFPRGIAGGVGRPGGGPTV